MYFRSCEVYKSPSAFARFIAAPGILHSFRIHRRDLSRIYDGRSASVMRLEVRRATRSGVFFAGTRAPRARDHPPRAIRFLPSSSFFSPVKNMSLFSLGEFRNTRSDASGIRKKQPSIRDVSSDNHRNM